MTAFLRGSHHILTDTRTKFEVTSSATFSKMKFQGLAYLSIANTRKTGNSILINAKEAVKHYEAWVGAFFKNGS